jgi:hypothetical protein
MQLKAGSTTDEHRRKRDFSEGQTDHQKVRIPLTPDQQLKPSGNPSRDRGIRGCD